MLMFDGWFQHQLRSIDWTNPESSSTTFLKTPSHFLNQHHPPQQRFEKTEPPSSPTKIAEIQRSNSTHHQFLRFFADVQSTHPGPCCRAGCCWNIHSSALWRGPSASPTAPSPAPGVRGQRCAMRRRRGAWRIWGGCWGCWGVGVAPKNGEFAKDEDSRVSRFLMVFVYTKPYKGWLGWISLDMPSVLSSTSRCFLQDTQVTVVDCQGRRPLVLSACYNHLPCAVHLLEVAHLGGETRCVVWKDQGWEVGLKGSTSTKL